MHAGGEEAPGYGVQEGEALGRRALAVAQGREGVGGMKMSSTERKQCSCIVWCLKKAPFMYVMELSRAREEDFRKVKAERERP